MAQKQIAVVCSLVLVLLWYGYRLRGTKAFERELFCFAGEVVGATQAKVHAAVSSHIASHASRTRLPSNNTSHRIRGIQDLLHDLLQRPILPNALSESDAPYSTTSPEPTTPGAGKDRLCAAFAGKRVTMVGSQHVHFLHKYLLRSRELSERKVHECPHREFCTHHHICLPPDSLPLDSDDHTAREDIPRLTKSPSIELLAETRSASIDYRMSDTLLAVPDESHWAYSLPYLDHITGIRLHESFWLTIAKKANVVILGRGPLSPPGETYSGNWTFVDGLPNYIKHVSMPDSIMGSRGNSARRQSTLETLKIVNAAMHATLARFLPDILETLDSIKHVVRPGRGKRLLWTGAWLRFPGRGSARKVMFHALQDLGLSQECSRDPRGLDIQLKLAMFLIAESKQKTDLEDPWTLYYNLQGRCKPSYTVH